MPWGKAAVLDGAVGVGHGAVGGIVPLFFASHTSRHFALALMVFKDVAPGTVGELLMAASDLVGRSKGSGKLPICRSLASIDSGSASRSWRGWGAWFEGLLVSGDELFGDRGIIDNLGGDSTGSAGIGEVSGQVDGHIANSDSGGKLLLLTLQAFLLFSEETSCLDFGPKSKVLELLD